MIDSTSGVWSAFGFAAGRLLRCGRAAVVGVAFGLLVARARVVARGVDDRVPVARVARVAAAPEAARPEEAPERDAGFCVVTVFWTHLVRSFGLSGTSSGAVERFHPYKRGLPLHVFPKPWGSKADPQVRRRSGGHRPELSP